ncbi:hypothetical protein [Rhodococcus sp. NPDC127528]|uniref:hypothetical protein n=1 Tax=unclassified Rhodococcus (in: high G+C Gram-positive bacteria) TaxID=192944 RepID=UPI003632F0D6
MATIVPAHGDTFPKLLLVDTSAAGEPRLLRALHVAGVAATPGGHDDVGQKLFGARIVADPAAEWDELRPWVRAVVAFGPDAWAVALPVLGIEEAGFAHGTTVSSAAAKPVALLGCLPLDDPELTDAMLAALLTAAQQAAGLSWGCGGRS